MFCLTRWDNWDASHSRCRAATGAASDVRLFCRWLKECPVSQQSVPVMQSVWSAVSSGSLQQRFHFVVVRCRAFMCPGSGLHSLWTTYSQMHPDGGGSSVASCWTALMISFWHNLHSQESSSPAGALDGPPVQTVWRGNVCWPKINVSLALSQIYQRGLFYPPPDTTAHAASAGHVSSSTLRFTHSTGWPLQRSHTS